MHTDRARATGRRTSTPGRWLAPLAAVVTLLAGLAVLLVPAAPAAAVTPPAQGWTTTEAPLPPDSGNGSTNPDVYLASSACPVANGCVSVGWYFDTTGRPWGLIEAQNGTTWTDTEAPQPPNHGTGPDQGLWFGSQECGFDLPCRAVSCPTATSCVAVGQYLDTAGYAEPVVDTLSNGSWTSAEGPLPSDTATDSGPNFPDALLYSVSCTSTTSCVAVGRYRNTADHYVGLIDTLSGTTWSATTAPLPTPSAPDTGSYPPTLTGVSCVSASFCAASGAYLDGGGDLTGLLEVYSNGTWSAVSAPQPAGAGNDGDGFQSALVSQVVCPSASSCTGVGIYEDNTGNDQGLIESWNGSAWAPTQAPLPAGAGLGFLQLGAVSCPSPTFCVSVGQYTDGSDKTRGLLETLSGGTWTGTQSPQPTAVPEADQYAVNWEVSCPAPGWCEVAGQYEEASTTYVATALTLSAGQWSVMAAPVPSNISGSSYARTVACNSPVACVLGGEYDDPGNLQGFLDTWTGAQGYWLGATDGGVFNYGNTAFKGSAGSLRLNQPVVGLAATPDGGGYWLAASDGGVFNYGDAAFHGSAGSLHLNKPVVGMAATPDGGGYWLVASDGGIFNYGDAGFFGSRGGQPLNKAIVGMAATADGKGYWLVASDGGIFNYGDAGFMGSTGSLVLNKPVVGMAATPTGLGYWLVASDGGIFNYGDAGFHGSAGSLVLNKPVVGMAGSPSGRGYWLVASDGGVFTYGDALFYGSAGSLVLNKPVVGMAG